MNVSPSTCDSSDSRPLRGFDKSRGRLVPAAVADDYEQALRETDRLRQDLARMEAILNEHREHEKSLKTHADDGAEAGRRHQGRAPTAKRSRIIREAQGRSDLLLEKTQARLEDIQREIDGLKLKRRDVETSIEATSRRCATRSSSSANRKRASARTRFCSIARATRRCSSAGQPDGRLEEQRQDVKAR